MTDDPEESPIRRALRLKQAAGVLSPEDLQDLSQYLKPDYNPDRDFVPPGVKLSDAKLDF